MSLKLKVIIFGLIIIAVMLILFWLAARNKSAQQPEIEEDADTQINVHHDSTPMYIDDVLKLVDYINKTPQETGIDEADVAADYSREIRYSGKLFGYDAHAEMTFTTGTPPIISGLYIHCNDISFHECRDELIKVYGEPLFEDENPYVESLGGVVTTCRFETDEVKINLSMASNYDYIDIDVRAK